MKYLISLFLLGCQMIPAISNLENTANKAIIGEINIKNINNFQLCAAINKTKGRNDLLDEFHLRGMDKTIRVSIIKNSTFPMIGMNLEEVLCIVNLNIISQSMSIYHTQHYLHLIVSVGASGHFRIMLENGIVKNISN